MTASNFPALTGPSSTVSERIVSRGYSRMERAMYCDNDMKANMEGIRDLCAAARKVVGFSPIEPKMLKIQMEGFGAKDLQEAVLMEIKLYLKCEMKMPPSEIEKLEIIRIFPLARDDWNVLYVEFGSDHDVNNIFSYTRRILNMENKITHWIPRQMYEEKNRAVESLAYTIRQDEKLKTRVKIENHPPQFGIIGNFQIPCHKLTWISSVCHHQKYLHHQERASFISSEKSSTSVPSITTNRPTKSLDNGSFNLTMAKCYWFSLLQF